MFGFAVSGHWPYAKKYGGAMAVANFNFSILMRNEIFGRLLYLFVNTLFAKVRRTLRALVRYLALTYAIVDSYDLAAWVYICPAGDGASTFSRATYTYSSLMI